MPIRRILNFLRLFFLVVCVAAIGARVAWTRYPDQVERVDNWIVKTSEHRIRRELGRAEKATRADQHETALDHLMNVADATAEVKHGDRLEGLREQALTSLRDIAFAAGDDETALRWAEELHELHDRNTPNELVRAKLLQRKGETEAALVLLSQLSYLSKGRADYTLPYFDALVAAGRDADALRLLLMLDEVSGLELPAGSWELRHRVPGIAWSKAVSMGLTRASEEALWTGEAALEVASDQIEELRVDLPAGATLSARDFAVTLRLASGIERTLRADAIQRFNQLEPIEAGFQAASGSDAFVVLNVAELPADDAVVAGRIETQLTPVIPPTIHEFLVSDGGKAALAELEASLTAPPQIFTDVQVPEPGYVAFSVPKDVLKAKIESLKEVLRG